MKKSQKINNIQCDIDGINNEIQGEKEFLRQQKEQARARINELKAEKYFLIHKLEKLSS